MKEKINYTLKKSKSVFIIVLVLWVILSIVLIAPMSVSLVESQIEGNGNFIDILLNNFNKVGDNLGKVFTADYRATFFKGNLYLIIALLFFGIVGLIKSMPKHDYAGVENGSSDWATGEQYSVLSRNKGILLAEKHYLPVDKRGNVNVMVVGRFWFW